MADLSTSKRAEGEHLPADTVESMFRGCESLVTSQEIKDEYLWGLPLKSFVTGQVFPDKQIDRQIEKAIPELEELMNLRIGAAQIVERQEFDRNLYAMMGYMQLRQKPVTTFDSLEVFTSNDQSLWRVSNDWIDKGRLHEGLVYIVPINVAVASSAGSGGAAGGAAFLAILGQQSYVPAYWRATYTVGWETGALPTVINTLIGLQASIQILTILSATNASNSSKSLGIGGLSQSSSNPGPDIYAKAVESLSLRRDQLAGKIKARLGGSFFVTSF